jgi:hypothetical protein
MDPVINGKPASRKNDNAAQEPSRFDESERKQAAKCPINLAPAVDTVPMTVQDRNDHTKKFALDNSSRKPPSKLELASLSQEPSKSRKWHLPSRKTEMPSMIGHRRNWRKSPARLLRLDKIQRINNIYPGKEPL